MAGRGTDIKLGGNKDFIEEGKINDIEKIKKDETKVKRLGGLCSLLEQKDMKADELTISLEVEQEDKETREVQYFL